MERYLERIRAIHFERVDSYHLIESGWTNIVFEINGRWIYRFVRDTANTQVLVEGDFLPRFERVSPVQIPILMDQGEDYIAYSKIEGERIDPNAFCTYTATQQNEIMRLLAEFLAILHDYRYSHSALSEAPHGGGDFWGELWPLVSPKLSDNSKLTAERFFSEAIDQIHAVSFEKKITHSDLATGNILVDSKSNTLSGIIDFGDMCIGDPATDFAGFYRRFGRSFTQDLLQYYSRPIEANFWTRIEYESIRKIFFVVYFAINNGRETEVPCTIEYIESIFQP